MDAWNDYEDEMRWPSAEQAEDILSGREVDDPYAERLQARVVELRRGMLEEMTAEVAERHLTAMIETARALGETGAIVIRGPATRHRPRRWRLAAVALAAALLLATAIAAAVTLPRSSVDAPEEKVPASVSPEKDAQPVKSEDVPPSGSEAPRLRGCERGDVCARLHGSQDNAGGDPAVDGEGTESTAGGGDGGGAEIGSGGGSGDIDGGSGGGGNDLGSGGGGGGIQGGDGGGGNGFGSGGGSGGPQGGGGGPDGQPPAGPPPGAGLDVGGPGDHPTP